jgi:hypothetical protein
MKSFFLKVRMSADSYLRLKDRAAEAGKPISTFAHALLEQENSISSTAIQLSEIKSQLQGLAVLLVTSSNPSQTSGCLNSILNEVLLIVRELALERNAQILGRVSAQIRLHSLGAKNE